MNLLVPCIDFSMQHKQLSEWSLKTWRYTIVEVDININDPEFAANLVQAMPALVKQR